MKIKIREGLEIGEGCPPFIIAEVGSNWSTLDDCLSSIRKAKECGADAVKFQLFDHVALYGRPNLDGNSYMAGALPVENLKYLRQECDRVGIEFMCSAFSPELIEVVDPFVNVHKLASAEMCHVQMLYKLRDVGKPVIMSTGNHGPYDIGQAINYLYCTPIVLMYCVPEYPARATNFNDLEFLKYFKFPVGFSDHSLDVYVIPKEAIERGACVIEKHVQFVDGSFPDSGHSLNAWEFTCMVDNIKKDFGARHFVQIGKDMTVRHNRRIIAIEDIKEGEMFSDENIGIYRSLIDAPLALSPFKIATTLGRKAKREIKAGNGVTEEDV